MIYTKQNFQDDQVLYAAQLEKIEDGLQDIEKLSPSLHVWRVASGTDVLLGEAAAQVLSTKSNTNVNDGWDTRSYSDSVSVSGGSVSLVDPQTVEVSSVSAAEVLKGKFTTYGAAVYYIPEDATFTQNTTNTGSVILSYTISADKAQRVTAVGESSGGYVASSDRNAYPDTGEYTYLGQLGDAFNGGLPAYTEEDYGKFLSPSADGFQWAEPAALPAAEEASF